MGRGKHKHRQRVTKAPLRGNQKNTIKQIPIQVFLQLRFSDPEGAARFFPKGFEAEVRFGVDQKIETRKVVDEQGLLQFKVTRDEAKKFEYFRLHFKAKDKNHMICEKRGEEKKSEVLGNTPTADEKGKDGQRFFRFPPQWSLLTSDWTVSADENIYDKAEKQKKFLLTDNGSPRSIGTQEAPVAMLLDPHWQYLKFEYFDRYYGHSDHDNKPISIPPVTVEGFPDSQQEQSTIRSNWTIDPENDEKKLVQCLPWILQAKEDGTARPKPDKEASLKFVQPKDTYVISKSATERKVKSLVAPFEKEDAESLKPCVNRLKYYDLPELWKSKKYWCRLSDEKTEKEFFEKMADKKTAAAKPLVFSLDDIILTDDQLTALAMQQTDKVVLFYHEFVDPASAANPRGTGGRAEAKYLKNGLYKPGLDQAAINAQAKIEKEARDKAEATRKKREEETARQIAEHQAEKTGAKRTDIKKAGDEAVASLPNDKEAQQRIKDTGDKAAAHATKKALADGKIKESTENLSVLAVEPSQIVSKARTKQRAVEEKPLREAAEEKQRKIEEDNARKKAEEDARGKNLPPKDVKAAGMKAAADVANDKDAQARIKTAAANAAMSVNTDEEAKKRIREAGENAEKAAVAFPYSDITRHEDVPNYISDYPHWSRLVIFDGNIFEVFDKRTKTGDVIGARAAVRLVDATPKGIGEAPGLGVVPVKDVMPGKDKQEEVYFILQPYYRQNFMEHSMNHKAGAGDRFLNQGDYDELTNPQTVAKAAIGRSELGLLRVCNYNDTNDEEAVVFAYHRNHFDFSSKPNELGDAVPDSRRTDHAPPYPIGEAELRQEARPVWVKDFVINCANRWNGNDLVNTNRAWIQEKKDANPKFRAQVVSFIQNLPQPHAHYKINVTRDGAYLDTWGGGEFDVDDGRDTNGMTNDIKFGGAHEYGHAGGQPDDYVPTTDYRQFKFGSLNLPGGPYDLDEDAMMKSNHQVRARSFWHITEWLRGLKPFSDRKFQVLHGTFQYEVPHYNHIDTYAGRNYVHWAPKARIFYEPSDPISYDACLYFLGKDEFRQAQGDADGILVVMVKSYFKFNDYTDQELIIEHVFNRLNQKIGTALNDTRVHARFSLPGIDRGTADTFMKCMLHFSPRFEVTTGLPEHLNVEIKTPDPADPVKRWGVVDVGAKKITSQHTEAQMHGKFNDGSIDENTEILQRDSGIKAWSGYNKAKNWDAFEAKFTKDSVPRGLKFRFPENVGTLGGFDPVITRLENVFFKHVCEMLGLSDDSTKPNYYQNADAYKNIVKACVMNDALNPTMSRP